MQLPQCKIMDPVLTTIMNIHHFNDDDRCYHCLNSVQLSTHKSPIPRMCGHRHMLVFQTPSLLFLTRDRTGGRALRVSSETPQKTIMKPRQATKLHRIKKQEERRIATGYSGSSHLSETSVPRECGQHRKLYREGTRPS